MDEREELWGTRFGRRTLAIEDMICYIAEVAYPHKLPIGTSKTRLKLSAYCIDSAQHQQGGGRRPRSRDPFARKARGCMANDKCCKVIIYVSIHALQIILVFFFPSSIQLQLFLAPIPCPDVMFDFLFLPLRANKRAAGSPCEIPLYAGISALVASPCS